MGTGAKREGEEEKLRQTALSTEPTAGLDLDLKTWASRPELKPRVKFA